MEKNIFIFKIFYNIIIVFLSFSSELIIFFLNSIKYKERLVLFLKIKIYNHYSNVNIYLFFKEHPN